MDHNFINKKMSLVGRVSDLISISYSALVESIISGKNCFIPPFDMGKQNN